MPTEDLKGGVTTVAARVTREEQTDRQDRAVTEWHHIASSGKHDWPGFILRKRCIRWFN